jgi:hypothetical protein
MMEGQSKLRLLVHGLDGLSAAGCGVNGSMGPFCSEKLHD